MKKSVFSILLTITLIFSITCATFASALPDEINEEAQSHDTFIAGEITVNGMTFQLPLTEKDLEENGFILTTPQSVIDHLSEKGMRQYSLKTDLSKSVYVQVDEDGYVTDIVEILFHSVNDENEDTYIPQTDLFYKDMDVFGIHYGSSYGDIYSLFDEVYVGRGEDGYIVLDDSNVILLYSLPVTEQGVYPKGLRLHMGDAEMVDTIRQSWEGRKVKSIVSSVQNNILFPKLGYDIRLNPEKEDKYIINALEFLPNGTARFDVQNATTNKVLGTGLILPLINEKGCYAASLLRIGMSKYQQTPTNLGITSEGVEYGMFYPSRYSSAFGDGDLWEILPEQIAVIFTADIEMTYFIGDLQFSVDGGNTYYTLSDGSNSVMSPEEMYSASEPATTTVPAFIAPELIVRDNTVSFQE